MKIDAKLFDRLKRACPNDGYLGVSMYTCDSTGKLCADIRPGGYVCAENYYGYAISLVTCENGVLTLTPCESDEE